MGNYSFLNRLFITIVLVVLASCTTNVRIVDGYVKNAIRLNIKVDSDLNYYNDQPHSLHMVIFELSSPDRFRSAIVKQKSRLRMLEGKWNDKSIKSVHELTFQPGESRTFSIDRAKEGRYMGLVAGYFDASEVINQVKLFSIELHQEKKLWQVAKTKQLLINIHLGSLGVGN